MAKGSKNTSTTARIPIYTEMPEPAELMSKFYEMLTDTTMGKAEVLSFIRQNCIKFPPLQDIFGIVTEEMIEEIREIDNMEDSQSMHVNIIDQKNFETLNVVKMTKQQKAQLVEIPTREEARFLEDIYYQTQNRRLAIASQLRALKQGADNDIEDDSRSTRNKSFLEYYLLNMQIVEGETAKALEAFSDTRYLSRWAKSVTGIGPVISTCLVANLEIIPNATGIDTDMHAGNWWSYCGLNDNRRPWLGNKKATEIVEATIKEHNNLLDDSTVADISAKTQWSMDHFSAYALSDNGTWNKAKLIAAASLIPYNRKMKVLMYKIGHSFSFSQNRPQSLYGRLLKQRKDMELIKNERGEYADQAKKILETKNFNKSTNAYKAYAEGMLPLAHINMRAQRYATKLFISHLFEAEYWNKFGKPAPAPYVLSFVEGHADYIPPEVPYDSIPRDCEMGYNN